MNRQIKIIIPYSLVEQYRHLQTNEGKEKKSVIVKVGNKWKIRGKKVKYWNADYDTKSDAKDALKAYWANKYESIVSNNYRRLKIEGFRSDDGKALIRNVQHYLIKVFGPTLYFDNITDTSMDLHYKGDIVAEVLYNNSTDEVVIMPEDSDIAPVSFYDTSEFEIQDYLSDLILGDI